MVVGGELLSDIWNDCCDFCFRVDDTRREVEVCNTMTVRCRSDTYLTGPEWLSVSSSGLVTAWI